MLYSNSKKQAIEILKKAHEKYNYTQKKFNEMGEDLYRERQRATELISDIEFLINSIAKTPKEFEILIEKIHSELTDFKQAEDYAREAYETALKTGSGLVGGVAAGGAIAAMAPTAAMWVATTFGTASTGTAISSLSGAVATKAALAWLGGGALSAGGAGAAGGQALLALAGPIGWGIAGASTALSVGIMAHKNKTISVQAMEEAKTVTLAGALLRELSEKILNLHGATQLLRKNLGNQHLELYYLRGSDYSTLTYEEQTALGALANNTLALSELINKRIE